MAAPVLETNVGIVPCLVAPVDAGFFVGSGCDQTVVVDLNNRCDVAVVVQSAGPATTERCSADCPEILVGDSNSPVEVLPGAQYRLVLRVSGAQETRATAHVPLSVSQAGGTSEVFAHAAIGVSPRAIITGSITFFDYATDVLVVVDASPSMMTRAGRIDTELRALVRNLAAFRPPLHLALTTGDPEADGGTFLASPTNPATIAFDDPMAEARVTDKVNSIDWNATSRRMLEAARLALSPQMLAGPNGGFLRDRRILGVLILTDGPDTSPGAPESYVAAYADAGTGRPTNLLSVDAVAGFDASVNCGAASDDGRLRAAVASTFGTATDICSSEWRLDALYAFNDTEPSPNFTFAAPVDRSLPMHIYLDGIEVPEISGSGQRNWTYFAPNNSISFESAAAPRRGQTLSWSFTRLPQCGP